LYRLALAEKGLTRAFGAEGIQWLPNQESVLDQEAQGSVREVISRYANVAQRVTATRMDRSYAYKRLPSLKSDRITALVRLSLSPPPGHQEQHEGLCNAVQNGWVEIVLALLEWEGRPDFKDESNELMPVLSYAAKNGNMEIVKALLERGASPNIRDSRWRTLLSHAAESGTLEIVRLLLDHLDLSEDLDDEENDTPLWFAAYGGNCDVISLLFERYRDLKTKHGEERRTVISTRGMITALRH
jgi:hypothetical protein